MSCTRLIEGVPFMPGLRALPARPALTLSGLDHERLDARERLRGEAQISGLNFSNLNGDGMTAPRIRKKVIFLTADELEEQADRRASEAEQLPEGEAKQNALRTATQLKVYATMKRVLAPQTTRSR